MVSLFVAFLITVAAVPEPAGPDIKITPPGRFDLDSEALQARALAAMVLPYRYGVTQMPCAASEWQPQRGWHPAREPSGRIRWVIGPVTGVRWTGIYGTCTIQSPVAREAVPELDRRALECECNGWLPSQ